MFRKIPTAKPAVKLSVKFGSTNMRFVNYSGLTFSPDFQNTEELSKRCFKKVVVPHRLILWFKVGERYMKVY